MLNSVYFAETSRNYLSTFMKLISVKFVDRNILGLASLERLGPFDPEARRSEC